MVDVWGLTITLAYFLIGIFISDLIRGKDRLSVWIVIFWPIIAIVFGCIYIVLFVCAGFILFIELIKFIREANKK